MDDRKNLKKKIRKAQIAAVEQILENEFFAEADVSTVDVKSAQAGVIKIMEKVNRLNWQQLLKMNCIKEGEDHLQPDKPMNDYNSILIGQEMLNIKDDPKVNKLLDLPGNTNSVQVNLYSSVMQNQEGKAAIKAVAIAESNIRAIRMRPQSAAKSDGSALNLAQNQGQDKQAFA